jgi:ribosomal protein S12 methylthiotransferase
MDTEVMMYHLVEAGYTVVAEESEADVIVVNTCAFIESAVREAIDNVLDVAWLKENRSLRAIVVTGCLAERFGKELFDEMPEIDAIVGVGSIHNIAEAVDEALRGSKYASVEDRDKVALGGSRIVTTGDAYAYIKIAEGCSNHCTFCAIPSIRGKMRSRPIDDVVAEAKELSDMGIVELDVIAQDTTSYGLDLYGRLALAELAERLANETDFHFIRFLYLYPDRVTDEFLDVVAKHDNLVPYFDLPIQHISDTVLKRMNRRGDGSTVRDAIARIRSRIPDAIIRTTVMVGFPGETEDDFTELCEFVRETGFDRLGAFTYSAEEGTPAARLPDQIDEQTKQDRYDIIMSAQLDIAADKSERRVGSECEVLCEGYDAVAECFFGRSAAEAPEVDGRIYFTASGSEERPDEGDLVRVKLTRAVDYDLFGEMTSFADL